MNDIMNCLKRPEIFDAAEMAAVADALSASYNDGTGVNLQENHNLPARSEVLSIVEKFQELLFPGFDGSPRSRAELPQETTTLLNSLKEQLFDQISRAVRYICKEEDCANCVAFERSCAATKAVIAKLPEIREALKKDVAAAYSGDPAARCFDEIILSYPCIKAISIQRIAHEMYLLQIPLIPRMMTEYAHAVTGIDIHPGARLGEGVFIDHGTGVVIGETAEIGSNVRIYQGVTLGALSFPKDACGMLIKGRKRHPSVCDNVTIYAGATVLGDITIGANCIIGGNVWLTETLPPGTKITSSPPDQQLFPPKKREEK